MMASIPRDLLGVVLDGQVERGTKQHGVDATFGSQSSVPANLNATREGRDTKRWPLHVRRFDSGQFGKSSSHPSTTFDCSECVDCVPWRSLQFQCRSGVKAIVDNQGYIVVKYGISYTISNVQ